LFLQWLCSKYWEEFQFVDLIHISLKQGSNTRHHIWYCVVQRNSLGQVRLFSKHISWFWFTPRPIKLWPWSQKPSIHSTRHLFNLLNKLETLVSVIIFIKKTIIYFQLVCNSMHAGQDIMSEQKPNWLYYSQNPVSGFNLNQLNQVQHFIHNLCNIHYNTSCPPTSRSPSWSVSH